MAKTEQGSRKTRNATQIAHLVTVARAITVRSQRLHKQDVEAGAGVPVPNPGLSSVGHYWATCLPSREHSEMVLSDFSQFAASSKINVFQSSLQRLHIGHIDFVLN